MSPPSEPPYRLFHGDCRERLQEIAAASIDAAITDPPYAEIDRDYGRLAEADWHDLMRDVVRETRRVLKPQGSAVFILQPNSEHVGQMRPWLWEFVAEQAREWNLVQDVYWWNPTSPPNVHCQARYGLMRPSVKMCVWLGAPDCYRNQEAIRWSPSEAMRQQAKAASWALRCTPSGYSTRAGRIQETVERRGRVTPYNLLPIANSYAKDSAGAYGHGAGTPLELCDWWTRYLVPPQGTALDMFAGTATSGVAAIRQGKYWIGIEKKARYVEIARARLEHTTQEKEHANFARSGWKRNSASSRSPFST